ncbi:MAG: MFS transporter [Phycisphaerales bacterium]|nr:MFS transporter [Phycisphaerales bacterium]
MWKHYFNLPRPVYILCLGTFVNRAGSFFIVFLTIYLSQKLGFPTTFATKCMGLFGIGSLVASLVGGQLADQVGRRVVMLISLFGGALILAVFGFLQSKYLIMAATLAFSLCIEMYRPAASAMIGDLVKSDQRTHAFGLMYISINLGFTAGALIGGKLATVSFLWLFCGDALTTFAYGMIILLFISETLPSRRKTPFPVIVDGEEFTGTPLPPEKSATLTEAAAHISRDWPFLLFCLSCLLTGLVFMQSMSTFPLYLSELGFAPDDYGRIIAINGILIVLFQLPITSFISRFNRVTVIMLAAAIQGIGFGLIGYAATLYQFSLTIVVWTVGEMMQAPFTFAIVTDLAPSALRGRYMGVFTMCFSSALMFGAPLGGMILADLGPAYLWNGCLIVNIIAVSLFFLIHKPVTNRSDAQLNLD